MSRPLVLSLLLTLIGAGCSGPGDGSDAGTTSDAASDAGPGIDFFANPDTSSQTETWSYLRIADDTRPGEGLPLDFVEVCLLDGSNCVPMTTVEASADSELDFAGLQDGPTAQDDQCTEASFTELESGNWVILGFEDPDEAIEPTSKINVWIGASECPLIPPGDKPFTISIGKDPNARAEFSEIDQCLGTCTVTP